MDEDEDSNLPAVETLTAEFNTFLGEFCELNTSVKVLLNETSEMDADQEGWFKPNANMFYNFAAKAEMDKRSASAHSRSYKGKWGDFSGG